MQFNEDKIKDCEIKIRQGQSHITRMTDDLRQRQVYINSLKEEMCRFKELFEIDKDSEKELKISQIFQYYFPFWSILSIRYLISFIIWSINPKKNNCIPTKISNAIKIKYGRRENMDLKSKAACHEINTK